MTRSLKGKTLVITGASRGIGLAIGVRAARDGANVVLLAKTTEPNPRLPGTLFTAAEEIQAAGGQALPVPTDIRDEAAVAAAVQAAVDRFGGIDILVNNASAISLTNTPMTPMKRFDLMFGVNVRGTYCCTQACLPHLIESAKAGRNPHVLNMSPPLSMREHWFRPHVAYTMAKYGMSECTLGHAGEFRPAGHRRQQPVAAHGHRHRGAADDPRRGPEAVPQARDPGRCRLVDPDQRIEGRQRALLHRRRTAAKPRCARSSIAMR